MPARTIEDTEVQFIKIAPRKFTGFKKYTILAAPPRSRTRRKLSSTALTAPILWAGQPNSRVSFAAQ
jgi:hypothetical protein